MIRQNKNFSVFTIALTEKTPLTAQINVYPFTDSLFIQQIFAVVPAEEPLLRLLSYLYEYVFSEEDRKKKVLQKALCVCVF